ncbi:MAG TPA: D-alanine--D-alanine ligase A, partial [Mycobacteriales bacterium]|nr:D-alanine--D-alanine ligase A [Mycobacteriales bacterium]
DFDAKYLDDSTDFDVPADLSGAQTEQVRELAVRAFEALGCEGLARVDFFLREDGTFVVNEANTMPGFTPVSMFPRMWTASGLDYPALVERLVRSALARRPGLR